MDHMIKKNKKHLLFGALVTFVNYAIGTIDEYQIVPYFIGNSMISKVANEMIFCNKEEDKEDELDNMSTESKKDIFYKCN